METDVWYADYGESDGGHARWDISHVTIVCLRPPMTNVYTKNFTIEEESIVTTYLANSGGGRRDCWSASNEVQPRLNIRKGLATRLVVKNNKGHSMYVGAEKVIPNSQPS